MEQFSLNKWLQDKSRKIVTRDGRPVRIVCWDIKSNTPIIAAIQWNDEREDCYFYNTIGRCANDVAEIDLFFADEEEELTQFEKAVRNILARYISNIDCFPETIKSEAESLLDLARKEIQQYIYDNGYRMGYELGKQDALKDLPKWKKCVGSTGPFIDDFRGEDYLHLKDYVIKVSELFEKLPKEK